MKSLEAPFNPLHPSSRCPKRKTRADRPLRHVFKTTGRKLIRTGVFATVMTCVNCGGTINGTEDYTVTASIFAI